MLVVAFCGQTRLLDLDFSSTETEDSIGNNEGDLKDTGFNVAALRVPKGRLSIRFVLIRILLLARCRSLSALRRMDLPAHNSVVKPEPVPEGRHSSSPARKCRDSEGKTVESRKGRHRAPQDGNPGGLTGHKRLVGNKPQLVLPIDRIRRLSNVRPDGSNPLGQFSPSIAKHDVLVYVRA
jgi:hypothetical protein